MDYVFTLIEQIVVMFLFIGVGLFIEKKKYFSETFIKELGDFLFKVIAPINMANSFMIGYTNERAKQLLISFVLSIALFVVGIFICRFIINPKKYPVEHYASIISNCGFMGLPLALYVCGSEAGIYTIPFITCNICLQMTYGNYVMSGNKNDIKLKSILTNNCVLGCIVGLVYFFARIPVITTVKSCCQTLSSMVAPISCILIGINLANTNILKSMQDKMGFVTIILRQLIIPLIAVALLMFVPNEMYMMKLSLIIVIATPPASGTSIFARKYNLDYEMASRLSCVSTLLSILTMPAVMTLATLMW